MRRAPADQRSPSYGIDAPYLLAVPALLVLFAIVEGVLDDQPWPFLARD